MNKPISIFLLGGPGSGKDYLLKNIFSRFDLTEVQADRILSGSAHIIENNQNIVINGIADFDKIEMIKNILEGYEFDYVHVSVTNKVSRIRNSMRNDPLVENKRIEKFLKAEKLSENYNCFKFNNSINLHESSDMEQIMFASQIEQLLERLVTLGLEIKESVPKDKKSGLPSKYVSGLTPAEIAAKKKQIAHNANLSDKDPEAYKDMPGDKRIREKGIPQSKYTKKYHDMYGEASSPAQQAAIAINMKKRGVKPKNEEVELDEGSADTSLSAKAAKSGISVGTLRKVYNRGVAAWNSGHRPGTTPAQWGHARVNSYITKGKTYHTADKDLHEETDIDALFEMQLVGTDSYRDHALSTTPGQSIEEPLADKNSCVCGGNGSCQCEVLPVPTRSFKDLRKEAKESTVDFTPELSKSAVKKKRSVAAPRGLDSTMQGLPVASRFTAFGEEVLNEEVNDDWFKNGSFETSKKAAPIKYETAEKAGTVQTLEGPVNHEAGHKIITGPKGEKYPVSPEKFKEYYHDHGDGTATPKPIAKQAKVADHDGVVHATWGDLNYEKGKHVIVRHGPGDYGVVEKGIFNQTYDTSNLKESLDLVESILYHMENDISLIENVYRPGSDKFFEMIKEAKRLYAEGKYTPADEFEKQMLKSDIGEKAIYEGKEVILDFPFELVSEEDSDPTNGHGIGKPFRKNGGGAVYVKDGGKVHLVNFSQSGMKKRINEPGRVRSFVARHHCLTNKDKTSAEYWACRWPRYFSNTGQQWW